MTNENQKKVDLANQTVSKIGSMPEGLNRRERKILERARRQHNPTSMVISDIHNLDPVNSLLEEDDLSISNHELAEYELAQEQTRLSLERYGIYHACGIPDSSIRTYYIGTFRGQVVEGAETLLWLQANPRLWQRNKHRALTYETHRKTFWKKSGNRLMVDEDSKELEQAITELTDIPIKDIFEEILRSRAEKIALIRLQIEWLETHQEATADLQPAQSDLAEKLPIEPPNPVAIPIIQDTETAFSLSGWELFWTKNRWSANPNHFVPIPTTSRSNTLESLASVARGEISIKPSSILDALEFHLRKDIIQRALATKNKYGPEGIKDWVKIKRGKDRIFFLPFDQNQAVFFAIGRDKAYRDI